MMVLYVYSYENTADTGFFLCLQFVSKAWEKVSDSVVRNSLYAARILDRDCPLPKVGDIVVVEDRDLNASFIDVADFLESDECDGSSGDDSDLDGSFRDEDCDE